MNKRLMLILGIVALILTSFSSGTAQKPGLTPKMEVIPIPADKIQPLKSLVVAGDKDDCFLEYTDWSPAIFFSGWGVGDKVAIYFDPTNCGYAQNYPFQLTDVELVLYDFAGVGSVNMRFSVEIVCPDICDGPGIEIYKSRVYHISTFYPDPVTIYFPELDTICLDKPFFLNLEYMSGDFGTTPSVLFDNQVVDTCYQWVYLPSYGLPFWVEWWDLWSPPPPGWIVLGIGGYCGDEQTECGEWYWKPDTTNAPSGMPDFDWHQLDKGLGLCGPTAVANCLWWFGHLPYPWTTPPELIGLLAGYFETGPGGTFVESMQRGLDMYFRDFHIPLKEITYWMPDFYDLLDAGLL